MAAYTEFQNILPDPNNQLGEGGQTSGTAGPGFAFENTVGIGNSVSQPYDLDFEFYVEMLTRCLRV